MSEFKVNKISPASGTDVTLGDSGDTFTIPSGATITNSGTQNGFGSTSASDLSSGTLPMARLSGTLPALNGSALTALNGSNIASGTVAAARLPALGKILQVVHNSTTTNYTVGSGDADVTNLNAVITPSATTSTILLLVRTHFYYAGSDSGWSMTIRRTVGGSNTDVYSDSTAYAYYGESGATNRRGEISLNYEDSPATTSEIIYQIRARKNSGTITLNENSIGSITAFEIGGS